MSAYLEGLTDRCQNADNADTGEVGVSYEMLRLGSGRVVLVHQSK